KRLQQVACSGEMLYMEQRKNGRITKLSIPSRTFNHHQRRAITARDGSCVIPGCTTPPGWCEVHHVIPWSEGGKTEVDNGVLLCWPHHNTINSSGWKIRMRNGAPQTKAPARLDPERRWRDHVPILTELRRLRALVRDGNH